jgi:putative zinc-binding metallo-peptidase
LRRNPALDITGCARTTVGRTFATGWYPPRRARTCVWPVGSTRPSPISRYGGIAAYSNGWKAQSGGWSTALVALGLPLVSKQQDPGGLAFAFLSDPDSAFRESNALLTGHANGRITLNIAEADDAVQERTRLEMSEVYRILFGHFRHESAITTGNGYSTKFLTRKGFLIEEQGMTYLTDTDPDLALRPLQAAACTYRIALGPRADPPPNSPLPSGSAP